LLLIAKALQAANSCILEEVRRDKQQCSQNSLRNASIHFPNQRAISYFDEHNLRSLDLLDGLRVTEPDEDLTELLQALADTSCLPIWRRAVDSLLDFQGQHYSHLSWKLAKQQALDILQQRDVAAEIFQDVEDELRSLTTEDIYDGIVGKIKILERFTTIYDAQPAPSTMEHNPDREQYYHLYPLGSRRGKEIAHAYPQRVSLLALKLRNANYSLAI
jgi:hypothetical protein